MSGLIFYSGAGVSELLGFYIIISLKMTPHGKERENAQDSRSPHKAPEMKQAIKAIN